MNHTINQAARYRQRPNECEAIQWTGANADALRAFAGSNFDTIDPEDRIEDPDQDAQILVEASHWVGIKPTDWVLKFDGYFVAKSDVPFRAVWEPAVLPSVVVSADRATLLRAAEALHGEAKRLTAEFNDSDILHEDGPAATVATWKHAAEFLRRMAAKEQPADDPLAGYLEELSAAAEAVVTPEKTERLLRQIAGRQLPAVGEQPDTAEHVCKPGAARYFCPTSGKTESACHGGFDVCCDRPDLHQLAGLERPDAQTREARPECAHCWREIEDRGTPSMDGNHYVKWVHVPGGFTACFPQRGGDSPVAEPRATEAPE
ncbi:hypothetical protein ABZ725_14195 [Streptomyces sp. NPDC006872]|uniref:hypothetical protein n=1 Tax=Streptomyces sp. NPDC006872 TaxID=3155720 RepID=UPI0033EEE9B1